MTASTQLGQAVLLNGVSSAGKSTIARQHSWLTSRPRGITWVST
jgi:chloramphenicol 3-O-phosphotransferase